MSIEETRLVELAKRGDADAFGLLVKDYERKVYAIAYRMLGDGEDAKDLAQEAFVRLYVSMKSFQGECSFSTWVYRIVSNLCIDRLRRKGKELARCSLDAPVQGDEDEFQRQVPDMSPGPEEIAERVELQEAVREGILSLPPEYRAMIVLRDVNGLSYEEIGEILGLNVGTVKSRLWRARQELSRRLSSSELLRAAFVNPAVKGGPADEVR
ncbi:MAG TPA: sigma-70 family RNA polymerase sigma factor [Firmicutes bacterium]|nr:sigma-70 family RNA polymerase sigma factor [Bacillota bacterium]